MQRSRQRLKCNLGRRSSLIGFYQKPTWWVSRFVDNETSTFHGLSVAGRFCDWTNRVRTRVCVCVAFTVRYSVLVFLPFFCAVLVLVQWNSYVVVCDRQGVFYGNQYSRFWLCRFKFL